MNKSPIAFWIFCLGISLSFGSANAKDVERIIVVFQSGLSCGTHVGGFNAIYENKKIEVWIQYNPNPANPVKHPIKVVRGDQTLNDIDWQNLLCDGTTPLSGQTILLEGKWSGKDFDAYSIDIDPRQSLTNVSVSSPPVKVYTPKPKSPERKAMMDAWRTEYPRKVIFVVKHLNVSNDWAWATASPQSPDGKERYEQQSALFHKVGSQWKLMSTLDLSDEDMPVIYRSIRAKFPQAPSLIFDR